MEKCFGVVGGCGGGASLESRGGGDGGGEAGRDEASERLEDASSPHELVELLNPVLCIHAIFL